MHRLAGMATAAGACDLQFEQIQYKLVLTACICHPADMYDLTGCRIAQKLQSTRRMDMVRKAVPYLDLSSCHGE